MTWPIAREGDPRFAAVGDLLSLWPPGPLPGVAALADALRAHLAPHGLRLVEAAAPPPRRKKATFDPRSIYEIRIAEAGEIPTRPDNLHDVCNALSWAAFPTAKWALTCRIAELQKARMAQDGSQPGTRDREHDRLALLDEGGLLRLRDAEGQNGADDPGGPRELGVLVGHALWQHAALGHAGIRAAVAPAPLPPGAEAHLPSFARASCREVRAAVDAAWLALVRSPDTLHAAMGGRAGEPIDEAALWRPAPPRPTPRPIASRRRWRLTPASARGRAGPPHGPPIARGAPLGAPGSSQTHETASRPHARSAGA